MISLLFVIFLPSIALLVSLILWPIKKLSNELIRIIVYVLFFGYIIFIFCSSNSRTSTFETILHCVIILLANYKQLDVYMNKLSSRGERNNDESYNYIHDSSELSDEDKLIHVVRVCLGSKEKPYGGYIFMSDNTHDLLVGHYDGDFGARAPRKAMIISE